MGRLTKGKFVERTSCALQRYQHQYQHQKEQNCDNLTQDQRKVAFHLWAAYGRAEYLKISKEENLTCPMLWCRESFPDSETALRHISSCPWLSNGWYWCPSCGRPEQFLVGKASRAGLPRHLTSSTLKRAFTFFKNIRLRTPSKTHRPTSCTSSTTDVSEIFNEYAETDVSYEVDAESSNLNEYAKADVFHEVDAESSNLNEYAKADVFHEVDAESSNLNEYAKADVSYEVDAESSNLNELAGSDYERYEMEGAKDCKSTTPYGPPHDSMYVDTPTDYDVLGSSLSDDENPPTYDDAPGLGYLADTGSPRDDPSSFMRQARHVHDDHLPPVPAYEYHDSVLDVKIPSTRSQVEDLRDLVHVFHDEWTKKLHLTPEDKAQHLASHLEIGVHALQNCYRGILPNTFDKIFALLHIAYAMTYAVYGNDASYPWAEFFHDMLQWQYAIPNKREAWLLVIAIKSLQASQHGPAVLLSHSNCPAPASIITTTSNTTRPDCPRDIRPFPTVGAQQSIDTFRPSHTVAEPLPTTLIEILKNGKVLYECSNFFNAFEYGHLVERSNKHSSLHWYQQQYAPDEHVPHTEEMIYNITNPLQAYMGSEALHDCVIDAESQLRNGLLRSTREVEAFLLSGGRYASLSHQVYQDYVKSVTDICDNYMPKARRDWREESYILDLEEIRIIFLEIDNSHRRKTPLLLQQSIQPTRSFANGNQIYESPASLMSIDPEALMSSSPSTMTSGKQRETSQSIVTDRSTRSPVSSLTTRSPSSSPTPAADTLYCEDCSRPFVGADRKSNFKRHRHFSESCGKGRTFKCTFSGCELVYLRTDNLRKHQRKVHNYNKSIHPTGVMKS